ncbi:hypothetical protein [Streptomyces oceani]|uniref:Uncharacterized protein n=1 Tax=Streptomyces oceani TaxID=1075402 RepID=A0A1E7KFZ7_9ACTN|nr:hypothetical protein [Streptomyces oceani]OEV02825.1 hypothetical protein AN216_15515 [Streptomyces oceani]
MSLIVTLARMEALASGRSQPLATVRHRHLSERPMVFVPLTTAGEAGAPLGALLGTDRAEPRLLVVPQPRNRDLRFAFLAELAARLLPHLESALDDVEHEQHGDEESELCADAPQLLVPNQPGVEFVRLLGRSMRFRRTAQDDPDAPHPVPTQVPLLGRWLTHYGERSRVPGSALLLSMTELLGRHWATGQSQLEDQHLGALLGWVAASDRDVEARDPAGQLRWPPAGPATDPAFDNHLLAPAVERYDADVPGAERQVRELIAGQLRPAWEDMWDGVELLRALPEGRRVGERWKRDRYSYTHHRDRVRAGEPPQPRRDDAVTAAAKLASREQAQARLDAQEALDDPLAMAARRLTGEAFAGEVVEVTPAWSEGKRPRPRPLVTVRSTDLPYLAVGGRAHRELPDGGRQSAELAAAPESGLFLLRLVSGMGRGKEPAPGSVPAAGDRVCWTLFEHSPRGGPGLPDPEDTPWTHGGPPVLGGEADSEASGGTGTTGGAEPHGRRLPAAREAAATDPAAGQADTAPDRVTTEDYL